MDYREKYLKYKDKYLKLKSNQKGGVIPNTLINTVEEIRTDRVTPEEINDNITQIIASSNRDNDVIDNDRCLTEILNFVKEFLNGINNKANNALRESGGNITFVSVGNTPYKVLKLFELLKNNPRLNFIYIPYSGKFTHGDVFLDEAGYNTGFSNLEVLINEQYTDEQLQHFNSMIFNSGLADAIQNSNKIIFVDFLETAKGFLSFLMTLDYFINNIFEGQFKRKIKVICIEYLDPEYAEPDFQIFSPHTWKYTWANGPDFITLKYPNIISENRILRNYPLEYIRLPSLITTCGQRFFMQEKFNDRCVKSYPKDRWVDDYRDFYDGIDLTNCNALLIYLYRRLDAERFVLA